MALLAESKFRDDASDYQAVTASRAAAAVRRWDKTAKLYFGNDETGGLRDQDWSFQRLQIPCLPRRCSTC